MASLRWSTAARIATRELRASRSKFVFVLLSIAIGVAALTGVRGFSAAFRDTLTLRARSILAADLSARMYGQPSAKEEQAILALATDGITISPVTELPGMATEAKSFDPLLVAVKAVDPAQYPFYGTVDLQPAMSLRDALRGDGVAVGEDLLIRLNLHLGDSIRLGEESFRITATIVSEPDRLSGAFAAGPRVLMSQDELDRTGLVGQGSRAGQRYLFHLPVQSDAAVAKLKERVQSALPEAMVTDYRETNTAVATALDRATALLSLVSLVALVLGAIGVAMAMRTHLQERMDTIAIMKSLGARSGHILRIYFLETAILGVVGGAIGITLGVTVQFALPWMIAHVVGVRPDLRLSPAAILTGLATGIVITMLFTLPPLLDVRKIRPLQMLRRTMTEESKPFMARVRDWFRTSRAQVVASVLIAAVLVVIATLLSDSKQVGRIFAAGLIGALLLLIAVSVLLLWLLRITLAKVRWRLPSVVRHGIANLYRPGNPSASLLAALGLGVMLIVAVFIVQHAFVHELDVSTRPDLPNVFLVDIAKNEVAGVSALLQHQAGVAGKPELLPVATAHIASIDGIPAAEVKVHGPRRMLQAMQITWANSLPDGAKVVGGQFWQSGETGFLLAMEHERAERLGLHLGSRVVFVAGDRPIDATLVALLEHNGQHIFSRADYILTPAAMLGVPAVWYGGVHVVPSQVGELQRSLFRSYPTITVINVAQALETVRRTLLQITIVVQFLAAFSIFSGLVILASAIAGTRYRRIREVVVLKTLGATRARIAAIFSVEFAMLGFVAGAVGVLLANAVARAALRSMTLAWHMPWSTSIIALLLTSMLAVLAGWAASFRILGQKPLEVLREE